ncbi:pentapeptide repeat-containing protein [Amycolatopsis sp. MtRt-6]|uniref:pentapeptide repeat-containing protein n=1 Tax=Amycolatopsis sp. MtRt-6 TaxID=2792782 RepID=UPI001A8D3C14|nr:pentapeptide repeat-containing protein [Amycolatopsis sp. MtRt-6]
MSTVTPFALLALIGAVSGSVTAWLLLRRDRPAEVLTPSAPPEPVPDEVAARLLADERAARLTALASFARQADGDPGLRQECVGEILGQFEDDWPDSPEWQAELWRLLRPHLRPDSPWFWPGMDLDLAGLVLHAVDLRGCEVRDASFRDVHFDGDARFGGTVFTGTANFAGACFGGRVDFTGATAAEFDFTGTQVGPW